ncbi:MAG: Rrf2 family transcriptional regulator [bacterium]|nr:Rrf2 family transcriptional regulator [bacterium]
MKITTRVRYGLRLLMELARRRGEGPVLLGEVARRQGISAKYLGQIVIPLRAARLLKSYRGAQGGYEIGRSPDRITLRDVWEAVEGGVVLIECAKDSSACPRSRRCAARAVWKRLNDRMERYLDSVTIADLAARPRGGPGR